MRFLSNKEKKVLKEQLPFGYDFDKKDEITQRNKTIYKNKEVFLLTINKGEFLPHLKSIKDDTLKSVFVDRGAIPFIIKGADLMRPGIHKIDKEIKENEIISIKDENHNKILAIGTCLFNSKELELQEKGKSVKIIHYVGDEYY